MSIEKMHERIRTFRDKECGAGSSIERISEAEKALGAAFSLSYRQFLRKFGWVRFSHQELYGLGSDVPAYLELVRNALVEREGMYPPIPPVLVPVMNDGSGNHYCLDTSRMVNNECPVVFWDHDLDEDQEPEFVSPSFDVWLIELLDRLQGAGLEGSA